MIVNWINIFYVGVISSRAPTSGSYIILGRHRFNLICRPNGPVTHVSHLPPADITMAINWQSTVGTCAAGRRSWRQQGRSVVENSVRVWPETSRKERRDDWVVVRSSSDNKRKTQCNNGKVMKVRLRFNGKTCRTRVANAQQYHDRPESVGAFDAPLPGFLS